MAQAVGSWSLTSENWVQARVGFVVDRVALGQVFLLVVRVSPVSIIPPWLSILKYHLEDEQ
jgi:hypothetical protein